MYGIGLIFALAGIFLLLLIAVGILRDILSKLDDIKRQGLDWPVALPDAIKLTVAPGDTVIFRTFGKVSQAEAQHVNDRMQALLPDGVKFAFVNGIDVTVLSAGD